MGQDPVELKLFFIADRIDADWLSEIAGFPATYPAVFCLVYFQLLQRPAGSLESNERIIAILKNIYCAAVEFE